jgi:phage regulator Rha-like protein
MVVEIITTSSEAATTTTTASAMLVDDLDRPVTIREFNELIKRFDKLDEERAKDKKDRNEEIKKAENERSKAQTEWDNGNIVKWLRMYFKIHKGDDNNDLLTIQEHLKKEE